MILDVKTDRHNMCGTNDCDDDGCGWRCGCRPDTDDGVKERVEREYTDQK